MNKEKLETAKNLFFIALGLDIAVTALVVISDFWSVSVLKDISAGRITADQSTISTMEFWDSFAKLMFLTILGVGLALVKWLNTCYSYAKEEIGASGFKNESWTASGWIIPVFNLFKPYQVVNEIYKAGSPMYALPDGWRKESGSSLLVAWWIFWAVTHFIGLIVGKQIFKSALRDDLTLLQSMSMIEFHAWFCFAYLVIAVLWFVVAGSLTRRLLDRQHAGVDSPALVRFETVSRPVPSTVQPALSGVSQAQDAAMHNPEKESQHSPQMQSIASDYLQVDEETIYANIAEELHTGKTDKGLWTRSFAECEGDERQTKVLYIKRRAERLLDAEKARRLQLAREQAVLQEQERVEAAAQLAQQQLADKISQFQTGKSPSRDDVKLLASSASGVSEVAQITDRLKGNTLLHWCALLDLYHEASVFLRHGADASAKNGNGLRPHQLASSYELTALLKAAIKPMGTCPNCSTVMPLTNQACPKCGAIFEIGAVWNLIPVKI